MAKASGSDDRAKTAGDRARARRATTRKGGGGAADGGGSATPAVAGELLSADEAITMLGTTRPTFYRWLRSGHIRGVKVGRQWRFTREDVERFLSGQQPPIETAGQIRPLLDALGRWMQDAGAQERSAEDAGDLERVVDRLFSLGVAMRASDVHLEPQARQAVVRVRVDGELQTLAEYDLRLQPALAEQVKRLAACDVNEKTLPQDGRIRLSLEHEGRTREIVLRVSFLPATTGENVTMRILAQDHALPELAQMRLSPQQVAALGKATRLAWGIVVVTGPVGSGKTTTLLSMLREVTRENLKVMSVEDPVECIMDGMVQVQVRPQVGLTFARALKSILRSDPDVVLVGETRDVGTLQAAADTALTGHLVLTSMVTPDAAGAVQRMRDLELAPFLLADAVKMVIAQRLVRRLCRDCSQPAEPTPRELAAMERGARSGGLEWAALAKDFRRAVGCHRCSQTGYRGRSALMEIMEITPRLAEAIRSASSPEQLARLAVEEGMTTLVGDALRRVAAGETSLEEIRRVLDIDI